MFRGPLYALTFFSALGSGLMAGLFFAFSTFVMKALARLPPAQGIAAMQSINATIIRPSFLAVFLGTAVASLVLGVSALLSWERPGARYLLLGGALYLLGVIGVTGVFNVPRNDALAAVDPAQANAASLWASYVSEWTAWNHVRTAAALGATASFILALLG
ncbi:anthrone oxygenase family protein [Archangium lipolyticum]|uniref:anthrone oxygenase family protein n=1 Tax=Archangium lipolyticum TaxID=2970465 RepID=UPI00214A73AC|nr:anthrone oxygenase family protein [Archangium lipolyticum]